MEESCVLREKTHSYLKPPRCVALSPRKPQCSSLARDTVNRLEQRQGWGVYPRKFEAASLVLRPDPQPEHHPRPRTRLRKRQKGVGSATKHTQIRGACSSRKSCRYRQPSATVNQVYRASFLDLMLDTRRYPRKTLLSRPSCRERRTRPEELSRGGSSGRLSWIAAPKILRSFAVVESGPTKVSFARGNAAPMPCQNR